MQQLATKRLLFYPNIDKNLQAIASIKYEANTKNKPIIIEGQVIVPLLENFNEE